MTLDDAEKLARQQLSGDASADSHVKQLLRADKLARFIDDTLPVVKAAEAWRVGRVDAPPITLAEMDLLRAIDQMRAALAKEEP